MNGQATSSEFLFFPGVGTAAIYVGCAIFYSTIGHLPRTHLRDGFIWAAIVALTAFYLMGQKRLKLGTANPLTPIVLFAGVFGLIALNIPPFRFSDLYTYINLGWLQVHYHMNPYVHLIRDVPGWAKDPMFTNKWLENPCPYGFLFALITKVVCGLGANSFGRTLFLFKLFSLLVFAAVGLLIFAVGRRLRLARLDLTLYLFLWNPLIILHEIANGHNDLLLAFFVLLAIYLALVDCWLLVLPALTVGFLVKYIDLAIMPFALILTAKRRGSRSAALSCLISAALLALFAAPYIADAATFRFAPLAANLLLSENSLHSSIFTVYQALSDWFLELRAGTLWVDAALKIAIWAAVLVLLLIQALSLRKKSTVQQFVFMTIFGLSLVICLGTSKLEPWYLAVLLPLAVLLREGFWLRRTIVAISTLELLAFTFIGQAEILNYLVPVGIPFLYVAWQNSGTIKANAAGDWAVEPSQPVVRNQN